MADTIRTRVALLTSLFVDNQVGTIVEQTMRDLIVSLIPDEAVLSYAASLAWDLLASPIARVTLAGDATITLANGENGLGYRLVVKQDATGNRAVTLAGCTVLGTATWQTAAGAVNIITVDVSNGTRYVTVV